MFSLLTEERPITYAHLVSVWESLRKHLTMNIDTSVKYYQEHTNVVRNEHYLVRVLQSLMLSMNLPTERYYDNLKMHLPNYSISLGFTSPRSQGRLQRGMMYGVGIDECWIADFSDFDYLEALKDWKNLKAIRILKHPRSDLSLTPLDGRTLTDEEGMAVIVVNLPMLFMQYRAFTLEERSNAAKNGDYLIKPITQFIYRYVLSNALYSHYDVAIFNRFAALVEGKLLGSVKRRTPFGLPDHDAKLDGALIQLKSRLNASAMRLDEWLSNIPSLKSTAIETFLLPDYPIMRQINWAMNDVLEPILRAYVAHSEGAGRKNNGIFLTASDKLIRRIQSDKTYSLILPFDEYNRFEESLIAFNSMK